MFALAVFLCYFILHLMNERLLACLPFFCSHSFPPFSFVLIRALIDHLSAFKWKWKTTKIFSSFCSISKHFYIQRYVFSNHILCTHSLPLQLFRSKTLSKLRQHKVRSGARNVSAGKGDRRGCTKARVGFYQSLETISILFNFAYVTHTQIERTIKVEIDVECVMAVKVLDLNRQKL